MQERPEAVQHTHQLVVSGELRHARALTIMTLRSHVNPMGSHESE
jgi:hypothetical protein